MNPMIIDGTAFAKNFANELKERVHMLKTQHSIIPGLSVILVGENPASITYVKSKSKACEALGIYSQQHSLPSSVSQLQVLELIDQLNVDPKIHGILVQLPLPSHINEATISNRISPHKDVDAVHKENFGSVMVGDYSLLPCTAAGILKLVKSISPDLAGKECVVIGRSNIVGKPIAMLMLHENATVTICHSKTKELKKHCLNADILITAVGIPNFVTADMIKPGAIVVDAGINRGSDGKLYGDVEFNSSKEVAGFITPVPGGVGPMTIVMLMNNTLLAAENSV